MDFNLLFAVGGAAIGALVGWLVAVISSQKQQGHDRAELRLQAQSLASTQQELERSQSAYHQCEQQLRTGEREMRDLYARLATAEERLAPLAHWREECEQLNQELRAQRKVNSAQE